jgi:hypothetical protein
LFCTTRRLIRRKRTEHTNVNILRLTVADLNAIINVKLKTQNRRLEPMGQADPGETHELTGTGPGLARQESAGQVPRRVWHQTDMFLRSKPRPLVGYPDPLLTLALPHPFLPVLLQTRAITGSKCIFELLDLSLQMHLQTCSIMASKCISKLALSRRPTASQSYTIPASKCISKPS